MPKTVKVVTKRASAGGKGSRRRRVFVRLPNGEVRAVKVSEKKVTYSGVSLAAFSDEVDVPNRTGRKKIKRATGRTGYEIAESAYKIAGGVSPELRRMWQDYQEDRARYRQIIERDRGES